MKPVSLIVLAAAIDVVGKQLDEDKGIYHQTVEQIRSPLILARTVLGERGTNEEVQLLTAYHYMMVAYHRAKRVASSATGGRCSYTEELGLEALKAMFEGMKERYASRE